MVEVTIERVFRKIEESSTGPFPKVAIKVREKTVDGVDVADRWISTIGKKTIGTESWQDGDKVFINLIVTDKGYINFQLPDTKDLEIARLQSQLKSGAPTPAATTEVVVDMVPDVDF